MKIGSHRTTVQINPQLTKNLIAYAAAAGAGLLSLPQAAEARVVYTPANISIDANSTLPLDLNNDGIPDFLLQRAYLNHSSELWVSPAASGNGIRGANSYAAAAGFFGVPVGPQQQFLVESSIFMARSGSYGGISSFGGPWANAANRYLGLKFVIGGVTHFGWARLNVSSLSTAGGVVLTGYAYETIPNTRIKEGHTFGPTKPSNVSSTVDLSAPDTCAPALGLLALGEAGLSIWRRKEEVVL